MKLSKFFSGIFAVLGTVLAAGTVLLSLQALDREPVLLQVPEAALDRAEAMMEAVCAGDYAGASGYLYGTPDLGVDREPADETGALLWEAFQDSLRYSFTGECFATDSGLVRDVTVEFLDVSSVTEGLKDRAQTLLARRVAEAEDVDQIYDENGEYREDFVMEVLNDAVHQALEEDGTYASRQISLNMIWEDGQWWILPDTALLEAISGGIAG